MENSREGWSLVGDLCCKRGYQVNTSATVVMDLCGR
jgi:hypothetical protein